MDSQKLNVGTSGGTQSAAKSNLQAPAGAGLTGARSSSVQQGTAAQALTSNQGVTLSNRPVTTVSLNQAQAQTQAQSKPATIADKPKELNPLLLGVTVLFFLTAIVLVWSTMRSVKSTTKY